LGTASSKRYLVAAGSTKPAGLLIIMSRRPIKRVFLLGQMMFLTAQPKVTFVFLLMTEL